ncbi:MULTISPECIES: tyrosine-type recombinase/integrase [Devosia]|uniref:tyrosine-type recombinase/integrase n=1 Tax=Devosia TaxID=46913 RepID=UPI0031830B5D
MKCRSSRLGAGRHSDGGGLYLLVSKAGTKSWVFMWTPPGGKRREMGLGPFPAVGLGDARRAAEESRAMVAAGLDPIEQSRMAKVEIPTFGEASSKFLADIEGGFRNEKHRRQWHMTLETYCDAEMRAKPVGDISTDDVLRAVQPLWATKNETASRLRGRIERVLDYSKVKGWRSGENPALWRGHLKNVLPPRRKLQRGHHAAMPSKDLPTFMVRLQKSEAMAARALEFLILNASRSWEVLGARWEEFDFEDKIWTVPAERMKPGVEHQVPLSDAALAIVARLAEHKVGDYVFFGQRTGRPLSSSSMDMLMRRMKVHMYTVHGFRSTFRDWAGDHTEVQREVIEAALSHLIGTATERAYRRSTALAKRRKLMTTWAGFCNGGPTQHE